jgi:hypothetical protein
MTAVSEPVSENFCPHPPGQEDCLESTGDSICIRHGPSDPTCPIYKDCLNHDDEDHPRFLAAFNAAVAQMEHEWCRLLNLARDNDEDGMAASMMLALWVQNPANASPHPVGTPCAADGGTIKVSVKITELEKPRQCSHRPSPNVSFAIHNADLTESVRKKLLNPPDPNPPHEPQIWDINSFNPGELTMCEAFGHTRCHCMGLVRSPTDLWSTKSTDVHHGFWSR